MSSAAGANKATINCGISQICGFSHCCERPLGGEYSNWYSKVLEKPVYKPGWQPATSASLSLARPLEVSWSCCCRNLKVEEKMLLASLLGLCGIVAALPFPQDEDLPPMPVAKDFNLFSF